jgi:hypothetical protein
LDRDAETILIVRLNINSTTQPLITCKVLLTSPAVRTDEQSLLESIAAFNQQIKTGIYILI